jgi:hypothetical protein
MLTPYERAIKNKQQIKKLPHKLLAYFNGDVKIIFLRDKLVLKT